MWGWVGGGGGGGVNSCTYAYDEEHIIQKEKGHTGTGDFVGCGVTRLFVVPDEDGDDQIAECLPGGREDHHVSTTPPLDVGYADEGEEEI